MEQKDIMAVEESSLTPHRAREVLKGSTDYRRCDLRARMFDRTLQLLLGGAEKRIF